MDGRRESNEGRRVVVGGSREDTQSRPRKAVVHVAVLAVAAAAVSLSHMSSERESQKLRKALGEVRFVEYREETVRCARMVGWAVAPVFVLEDPSSRLLEIGDDETPHREAKLCLAFEVKSGSRIETVPRQGQQ